MQLQSAIRRPPYLIYFGRRFYFTSVVNNLSFIQYFTVPNMGIILYSSKKIRWNPLRVHQDKLILLMSILRYFKIILIHFKTGSDHFAFFMTMLRYCKIALKLFNSS